MVYARCDSLARLCSYYERSACTYKDSRDELHEEVRMLEEERSKHIKMMFVGFISGVIAGIVLTCKTKKLWEWARNP